MSEDNVLHLKSEDQQPEQFNPKMSDRKRKFKLSKGREVTLTQDSYACNGCGGHKKTPANFICPVCEGKGFLNT